MTRFRTLAPGAECGPYTIVEEIGRGGMAIVYLAEGPDGERCAIKTLQFARSLQPRQVKRFHREIHVVASINHVNVVRFHDAGRVDTGASGSLMWMAQEYVEGVTLREQLHRLGGKVPVRDVATWCEQIAGGVAAAHSAGVIHRDLKPENVMLVDAARLIKVIDFSISKFRQWGTTTTGHKQQPVGTMGYMAPEQLDGSLADIDERTDVYALGLILFELATGRFALAPDGSELTVGELMARTCTFTPPRIDSLVPGFPAELADIAERALRKRAADRFPTMVAMREALKTFEARYLLARRKAVLQATDWGPLGAEADRPTQPDTGWRPGQKRTVKLATPEQAVHHAAEQAADPAATAPFPDAVPPADTPLEATVASAPAAATQKAARSRNDGSPAPPPLALPPLATAAAAEPAPARQVAGDGVPPGNGVPPADGVPPGALLPSGNQATRRRWLLRGVGLALGAALGLVVSIIVAPWLGAAPLAASPAPARAPASATAVRAADAVPAASSATVSAATRPTGGEPAPPEAAGSTGAVATPPAPPPPAAQPPAWRPTPGSAPPSPPPTAPPTASAQSPYPEL